MEFNPIDGSKSVHDLKPFLPTAGKWLVKEQPFIPCYLTEVRANEEYKTKSGVTSPRLEFVFRNRPDDKATHETIQALYEPQKQEQVDMMMDKIQSIYMAFAEIPKTGIGGKGNFVEFIKKVAEDFNGKGNKKAIYENQPIWLKLTARDGYYNLPIRNFIEPHVKEKPCTLVLGTRESIDVKETLKPTSSSSAAPTAAGMPVAGNDPFDEYQ